MSAEARKLACRAASKRRNAERKAANLCGACGEPAAKGARSCPACIETREIKALAKREEATS